MSDRIASGVSYFSSALVVASSWGINEYMMFFGAAMGVVTFLYNKAHKQRMEKMEADFKKEMLEIARSKPGITLIDVQAKDED